MGNSDSSSNLVLPEESVALFREACEWAQLHHIEDENDRFIEQYLQEKFNYLLICKEKQSSVSSDDMHSPRPSTAPSSPADLRSPRPTSGRSTNGELSPIAAFAVSGKMRLPDSPHSFSNASEFMDSSFIRKWMPVVEADRLFEQLYEEGKHMQASMMAIQSTKNVKYPLSTLTYGVRRSVDGALALDRWGSYHESWCRVREPTDEVSKLCERVREHFQLPAYALNSVVVNYYWDGATTHIPAHQDTVACLEENSSVYCLSLGATREFVLCSRVDSGIFKKSDLHIANLWSVGHGDMFALGPDTNQSFCHAVPQDPTVPSLRISIIFRTVTKSFIDTGSHIRNKLVTYANGTERYFQAECVLSSSLSDAGTRTHISELIQQREDKKREKLQSKLIDKIRHTPVTAADRYGTIKTGRDDRLAAERMLDTEDPRMYFTGRGLTVPSMNEPSHITTSTTSVAPKPTVSAVYESRVRHGYTLMRPDSTDSNRLTNTTNSTETEIEPQSSECWNDWSDLSKSLTTAVTSSPSRVRSIPSHRRESVRGYHRADRGNILENRLYPYDSNDYDNFRVKYGEKRSETGRYRRVVTGKNKVTFAVPSNRVHYSEPMSEPATAPSVHHSGSHWPNDDEHNVTYTDAYTDTYSDRHIDRNTTVVVSDERPAMLRWLESSRRIVQG